MTWLKILLWLLPIGLTIFGIVLVVNRIRSHSSLFRIIIAIIEAIVFIWIGCMVPIVYTNNVEKTSSASMISAPASIPNITYGQAIEAACTAVKWDYFVTNDVGDCLIVEMNGKYQYKNVNNDIVIQFQYPDEYPGTSDIKTSSPMEICFLGFGDSQREAESTMKEILFLMFQKYATQNGITLDESQKEDILYNQAYKEKYKKNSSKEATATPEVTEEPIAEDESTGDGESSNDEDYYVSLIKESSPEAYPDYTYGVVFDNYFSNPNWGYAEIDKQKIVDFTGGCTWNGEDVNCEIQFQLNMDEGTFEVVYYEFDGNEQDLDEWPNVLDKIFGLTYEK